MKSKAVLIVSIVIAIGLGIGGFFYFERESIR